MPLFPILLKLKARKCVVVGAGQIAAAKAAGLLRSGARVVVIGPRAVEWIQSRARAGKLTWRRRRFVAADVERRVPGGCSHRLQRHQRRSLPSVH